MEILNETLHRIDVLQDVTHVSVVDCDGNKVCDGDCAAIPEAIGKTVKEYLPRTCGLIVGGYG